MNVREAVSQILPAFHSNNSIDSTLSLCPSERAEVSQRLSVQVASSVQAIEDLRSVWREWTHGLETDIDYYLHSLRNDAGILSPHVITIWEDGILQGMLVGLIRKQRISSIVSFVRLRGPRAKVLEIMNKGRIGRHSSAIDRLIALELLKALKSGNVDLVCFRRLPLHSELFHQVQRLPGLLVRKRVLHIFYYTVLSQAASDGELTAVFSGKSRRELRRKTRILQRAFPGKVRLECYSQPRELSVAIRDAMAVAATTWQYYLGCCGLSNISEPYLMFFARQGWLRIYILYVDDLPCAFLIGQLYNRTFYCQHAGYQPAFAHFSVGSLLTAWALEDIGAAGVEQVDLGEGGQEHNRRLGCQMCEEGTVHLYSSTLRGFWLNLFFASAQIVRVGGRRTLSGLRLNRVSKIWRESLIAGWKHQNPLF